MNKYIEVVVIVEGRTEEIFIKKLLGEYLADRKIYMIPIQMTKPGQKGGDVRFNRVIKDISLHIKQRNDTYISLLFDYYGVKEWPGLEEAKRKKEPQDIAKVINDATQHAVNNKLSKYHSSKRFVPNVSIHEFESLLFSEPNILARVLNVNLSETKSIVDQFSNPEMINNARDTAPSKRLESLNSHFKKTITGINIAQEIGIELMRSKCHVFNKWIDRLENLI